MLRFGDFDPKDPRVFAMGQLDNAAARKRVSPAALSADMLTDTIFSVRHMRRLHAERNMHRECVGRPPLATAARVACDILERKDPARSLATYTSAEMAKLVGIKPHTFSSNYMERVTHEFNLMRKWQGIHTNMELSMLEIKLGLIADATESLEIVTFEWTQTELVLPVLHAHQGVGRKKGVKVRILTDVNAVKGTARKYLTRLSPKESRCEQVRGNRAAHAKVYTVNGSMVYTTSANNSENALGAQKRADNTYGGLLRFKPHNFKVQELYYDRI